MRVRVRVQVGGRREVVDKVRLDVEDSVADNKVGMLGKRLGLLHQG